MRLVDRSVNVLFGLRLAAKRRFAKMTPDLDLNVTVMGGRPWLSEMLAPSAHIDQRARELVIIGPGGDEGARSAYPGGGPVFHYRSGSQRSVTTPFIQPHLSNPLRLAVPPSLPADLRELALAASFRSGESSITPASHRAYRAANETTATDLLKRMIEAMGRQVAATERVTVICVSNRPDQISNVLENYNRQAYESKQFLFVTNSDSFDGEEIRSALDQLPAATLLTMPERATLGRCLNEAVDSCETRYVAKFDDDDTYGAHFLTDMMIAHRYARAGVIGKHSYFARLPSGETILRFPGHDFGYTSFLAGGTLTIDIEKTRGVSFPDTSIGEDAGFLRRCRREGIDVFASDRFNYLQHRGQNNTWRIDDDSFKRGSVAVGAEVADTEIWA